MDRAPLPPHERPWRHPSELGPPQHEPATRAGRVLIVTTATLSLALIGLLVLTVTPDRSPAPSSAGSVTTRGAVVTFAALERPALPLVTPIGDEGWAVTTTGAITGRRDSIVSARLPSGDVVDVEIVSSDKDAGLTVVSLPTRESGYDLAEDSPAPSDTVLVNGRPPRVVAMDELGALDVDEGTAVLDGDGDLIGLCTSGERGTALRAVATMPPTSAPTTAAPATTSKPATTTVAPTTAAPPTSTTVASSTTGAPSSTLSGAGAASGESD